MTYQNHPAAAQSASSVRKTALNVEGSEASLVRAGTEAIGQWRRENPDKIIAGEGVIVTDLDLSGADLSIANLTGGHFTRCNLRHVSFANANLRAVKFDSCELQDAEFRGANLKAATIIAKNLDGARFGGDRSLGRLAVLHVINRVQRPILVDRTGLSWYDRWIGWDRLRFLTTIRIFVPAYASLTLTVLYLNGVAWYNSVVGFFKAPISPVNAEAGILLLPPVTPTWTHALILANFAFLALAATCFLGCPARVVEFSRERWLNEIQQPEIFYDHATWQRPGIRLLCAGTLLIGGLLSTFLLCRGILQQIIFIIHHLG